MEAKILLLDIETAPNKAYVWGLWDQNVAHEQVEETSYILCWSAKWLNESRIRYESIQDREPLMMLQEIWDLLDEADVVIHYNGTKFDIPTLNKEFIKHGFPPPSPFKQLDLLRVCRQAFRFESNKLTHVTEALGLGAKIKHKGFKLWVECMNGSESAWRNMRRYNKKDVRLLEKLYKRLLPWIERHPNLSVYKDKPACPNCSSELVQRRGKEVAISKWYIRFQCQSCGKWFKGKEQVKHV
jgi:uncharacterized protein